MYGSYTVDEASKTINVKFEGSSFAKFVGTEGKRIITSIDADGVQELKSRYFDRRQGQVDLEACEIAGVYPAIRPGNKPGADFWLA